MNETRQPTAWTRRGFLTMGSMATLAGLGLMRFAAADEALLKQAIMREVGDAEPAEGSMIHLELPEIAENGNTVPLKFEIDSPMTADDYVKSVHVFADGNPNPDVASFHFTPASGKAAASTRMRLAKTQNVVAVAEMSNGKTFMASKEVKVTIGGCGG